MNRDIAEGLRSCMNCRFPEDWERTEDGLHYVISKTCRACLMGTLEKDLPYPFKGWMPIYRPGVYIWRKEARGDLCPMDGRPIHYGKSMMKETCHGCYYQGKMSYVSDDILTVRCHYTLERNCSNCARTELKPISQECKKCIGHHYWKDSKPTMALEITP